MKTIKMGKANFLNVSDQHPISIETIMRRTETIMMHGVLTNVFLKVSDLMAQTQIKVVMQS